MSSIITLHFQDRENTDVTFQAEIIPRIGESVVSPIPIEGDWVVYSIQHIFYVIADLPLEVEQHVDIFLKEVDQNVSS